MLTFLNFFTSGIGNAINYLQKNVFIEQTVFNTIIFLVILIIVLIAFIFIYLFRKSKLAERKAFLQASFNNFIGEIAICESEIELNYVFSNPIHKKVILQFHQRRSDRNLLICELAETSKKFRGSTMENILWLFKNTNHKNDLLRMEAQIAIVKMTGFEGLKFLNNVTYPVSEWQQLRLIEELSNHSATEFGNISEWLISENITVTNFALRLVEIYRQHAFYDEVASCLSHPSMIICKSAVETISQISNETTADLLIAHYGIYDAFTQIKILKILQVEGSENQVPFLLSILNHGDDSYKLEAVKAIVNISETGVEKIEKMIDKSLFPWNVILPQIKNVA